MRLSSSISSTDWAGVELAAQLAQLERQQKQRGELRGEGLGRGHADLRAGVGVDGAVRLARHHGAHHVADGHGLRAQRFHLALRGQGVGGLAGLGDQQAERVAVRRWDCDSGYSLA